jgi:hypothetical protein
MILLWQVESMRIGEGFRAAYNAVERRMKALAETEGDFSCQILSHKGQSITCSSALKRRWARNAGEARSRVEAGFRKVILSIEDFVLHFCVRRYLCGAERRYQITDLSKGAMLVEHAIAPPG